MPAGNQQRAFQAVMTNPVDAEVGVIISTTSGTASSEDFAVVANQDIKFGIGDTSQDRGAATGTVRIYGDDINEDNEYYRILLTGVADNGLGQFIGVDSAADYIIGGITDDD